MNPAIDPAKIGFDFDGVIADTAESFLRIACEEHGFCDFRLEDITDFEVENCLGMSVETVATVFHKIMQDSLGTGLQPMFGALEVLSELAESVGTVTVVTARPLREPVLDWFAHFLPPKILPAMQIVAMGDHDDKTRHILAQGLQWFVDDRAETCMQVQAAGIQPLLFCQPWNRDCPEIEAVSSWQEIRSLLPLL
jgi:hypothetical protein